jgi:hypothetical protein
MEFIPELTRAGFGRAKAQEIGANDLFAVQFVKSFSSPLGGQTLDVFC